MWFQLREKHFCYSQLLACVFSFWLLFSFSTPLLANETTQANQLKQATASAWAKQPILNTALQRRAEFNARQSEASNLLKGPAAVTFERWTDRFTSRAGLVKYAAEFALPLWLPKEKAATQHYIEGETQYFESLLLSMQLKIANDVREAYWATRLSDAEVLSAQNQLDELTLISDDINRRLKAGFVSRFDAQVAMLQMQQSALVLVRAKADAFSKRNEFERITGTTFPLNKSERENRITSDQEDGFIARHPLIIALKISAQVAQKQLQLIKLSTRDTPELGIGMFRERGAIGSSFENVLTVRLRVPFASDNRSAGRIAAASATIDEAHANIELESARLASQSELVKAEFKSTEEVASITEKRLGLAADNLKLAQKAFELGQIDLPARLRAQNEFFDVNLSLRRNQIEQARAISRLHQALGLLP